MGTGYVGLVAGACLSDSGNHVICVDVDESKVALLKTGKSPIYEPGLEDLILRNVKGKRLGFTTDAAGSIGQSEVIFLAVGTPAGADGSADLKYLLEAVRTVRDCLKRDAVVVIKSTVPVGTSDKVRDLLKGAKHKAEVVSNPEFLKEGSAVTDFLKPERVVIGCESDHARQVMGDLYAPFVRSGNPILYMSNHSAELCKYAANGFLAMKISFINDLAQLSEKVGADIQDVRRALVTDGRIGSQFLYPGVGYGGSCFPKDVLSLIHVGKEQGMSLDLFSAVHETNERQKQVLFDKMKRFFKGDLKGKTVAIWGLSFKPMTDDMREAASVTLIHRLLAAGATVRAYDPVAAGEARRLFENKIQLFDDAYEAVHKADCLAVVTEWNEFRSPDYQALKKELTRPVIFDGRNLYNRATLARHGFTYFCIGQPDPV